MGKVQKPKQFCGQIEWYSSSSYRESTTFIQEREREREREREHSSSASSISEEAHCFSDFEACKREKDRERESCTSFTHLVTFLYFIWVFFYKTSHLSELSIEHREKKKKKKKKTQVRKC
ncbi:hypothetical protein RIF29_12277 [Crotalaria pallida]|uniref:Uncharacterized protein n=1 Tax=Crotalaria pallida TaxID=3830 RepID=A0AAN9IMZ0_CROPI